VGRPRNDKKYEISKRLDRHGFEREEQKREDSVDIK
jgi:hypothetical protein